MRTPALTGAFGGPILQNRTFFWTAPKATGLLRQGIAVDLAEAEAARRRLLGVDDQ